MTITKYLVHSVDIEKVTESLGDRTVTTVSNVPTFITQRREVDYSTRGSILASKTMLFFEPDQDISGKDHVVVNGESRPIEEIRKARDLQGVHHLEVVLR